MKKYNALDMKGRLYNFALEHRDTKKGDAITGNVMLEVDDKGTVVTLRFFANAVTNAGKANRTYGILEDMIAGNYRTVVDDGDEASWIGCTGQIDVSYFKGRDNELARSQKLRGGFLNANNEKKYANKWKLDYLIVNVEEIEADPEKGLDGYVRTTGYLVDDYNQRLMEVQFQARSAGAMEYILSLSPSYDMPHFVSTWGSIVKMSRLVVRKNAFGDDETDEYDSFQWVITGMNPEPYLFGDDAVLTEAEYTEMKAALAEHKEEKMADKDEDNGLAF